MGSSRSAGCRRAPRSSFARTPHLGARVIALGLQRGLAALFAVALCTAASGGPAAAAAAAVAGQFLVVSDLHFDPMADPELVDRLAAAEPADWPSILDGASGQSLGHYGADTNWRLLRSTFAEMKARLPHPAFVLIPGDFLAHHFRDRFDAAARDHSDREYRGFVGKTMWFLALRLEQAFPDTPILPALGNNDDDCGDFLLQPNGPFLADTLPILQALTRGGDAELGREWTRHGNYSAALPGVPSGRLVIANTVFFSRRYRNACGPAAGLDPRQPDPGEATLAWLAAELAAAERAHKRVWLVYHVPPGIDGFATWRQGSCPDTIVPMWTEAYARPFYALLRRYAGTVAASFAGHTHMDDFRLLSDAKGDDAFTLITPAVSPIFGQNPAFRTVAYDATGAILDETTYELTGLSAAGLSAAATAAPAWRREYTFTRGWHLPRIDLGSLGKLYARIGNTAKDRERWRTLFAVSSPVYWPRIARGGDEATAVRAFYCAAGHVAPADFRQCWCGSGKK